VRGFAEEQQALIAAWAALPEDDDSPHLLDVLSAGVRGRRFGDALEALAAATGISAGELPGLAEGLSQLSIQ
jgi:hypothetical protein